MVSVTHLLMRPGRRMSIMIGAIALLAVGMSPMASSQDQSTTIAKDAIFARKILMDTINTNMDELETMTTSDKGVNLAEGREHADLISVMLMRDHQSVEAQRRARSRPGHLCIARSFHQLRRFLCQGGGGGEDRLPRQPRPAGRRLQDVCGGAAGGMRLMPRALSQV